MFSSRSCTARMPAPKSPFPRMPRTITIVTTWRMAEPWLRVEHLGENEKENEREEVIEEEDRAIPARQLQIDLEKSEKRFHSLVAQTSCRSAR